MSKKVITVLAFLFLGEIQSQTCSCGGTIQQSIGETSILLSQDLLTSPFNVPQIASALVGSSVSNCLADTLQLLIVSDLIASNLNPRKTKSPLVLPVVSPIYETVPSPIFNPTVEFVPKKEVFSPSCASVVDIFEPRRSCIECLPSLCGVADVLSSVTNIPPMPNSELIPANANLVPACGPVSLKEIACPIQMAPLSPCFCNGLSELLGPVTEILYPQGIPTCNVGCASPPALLANFNLEPIPYTGFNYFY